MLQSVRPLVRVVFWIGCLFSIVGGPGRPMVMGDDSPLPAVEALKTLLADTNIAIGTDESFQAYVKKSGLVADTVAPRDLRTFVQSPGLSFSNIRTGVIQTDKAVVLTWWSEAKANGEDDVAAIASELRTRMQSLGFEETEEPQDRFARAEYQLMRRRAKVLLTFQKVNGACWQWVVIPVIDRNASRESKVGIAMQWLAAAPPADGSLTLKSALPLMPMWQCPATDGPVLESIGTVRLREFEAALEEGKLEPLAPSAWNRRGWRFEAPGDIRPELAKGITAAGYTLRPENSMVSPGSEIQGWERAEDRSGLSLLALLRPGAESTRLTAMRRAAFVPPPSTAVARSPVGAAPLPPGTVVSTLLKGSEVGTDAAFDAHKEAKGLSREAVAPAAMRALLTRPEMGFDWLDFAVHQDDHVLALQWQSESACDGEIAAIASTVGEQLEKAGYSKVAEELQGTLLGEDLSRLTRRARELLLYRKVTGEIRELVVIPIADLIPARTPAPGASLRIAIKWYVMADVTAPVTLKEAFRQCPELRPVDTEQSLVDALDRAPLHRWERWFEREARRRRPSIGLLVRGEAWTFQTSVDIRLDLKEALANSGYVHSPEDNVPQVGMESEHWRRDHERLTMSFMPPRAVRNETKPFLSVSLKRTPALP